MKHYTEYASQLEKLLNPGGIKVNEPMKKHTSFRIGGPVDILAYPETIEQVGAVTRFCKEMNIPFFVIGNGSNLLVKDGGIRGVAVKLRKLNKICVEGENITAESGASIIAVSSAALSNELTGLEFASGIPGSVGGAIAMNAGAFKGEISNVVVSVTVLDSDGNIKVLSNGELEFGYRTSAIIKHNYIVLEVKFKLEKGIHDKIYTRMHNLNQRRRDRQPLEFPSAGSTFKRPDGLIAAKLIEDSGLKGVNVGDAEVSVKHSGFIINKGNASARDVLDLMTIVKEKVRGKFDVELDPEVKIIGVDEE